MQKIKLKMLCHTNIIERLNFKTIDRHLSFSSFLYLQHVSKIT